jgi:hypothetical protein
MVFWYFNHVRACAGARVCVCVCVCARARARCVCRQSRDWYARRFREIRTESLAQVRVHCIEGWSMECYLCYSFLVSVVLTCVHVCLIVCCSK